MPARLPPRFLLPFRSYASYSTASSPLETFPYLPRSPQAPPPSSFSQRPSPAVASTLHTDPNLDLHPSQDNSDRSPYHLNLDLSLLDPAPVFLGRLHRVPNRARSVRRKLGLLLRRGTDGVDGDLAAQSSSLALLSPLEAVLQDYDSYPDDTKGRLRRLAEDAEKRDEHFDTHSVPDYTGDLGIAEGGWRLVDNGRSLQRAWTFRRFRDAWAFLRYVASITQQYHRCPPLIYSHGRFALIRLTTYVGNYVHGVERRMPAKGADEAIREPDGRINGLTRHDIQHATHIGRYAETFAPIGVGPENRSLWSAGGLDAFARESQRLLEIGREAEEREGERLRGLRGSKRPDDLYEDGDGEGEGEGERRSMDMDANMYADMEKDARRELEKELPDLIGTNWIGVAEARERAEGKKRKKMKGMKMRIGREEVKEARRDEK